MISLCPAFGRIYYVAHPGYYYPLLTWAGWLFPRLGAAIRKP